MAAPVSKENSVSGNEAGDKFYDDAKDYWASITPTVDGMLGGFAKISPTDINGSKAFLRSFLKLTGGTVTPDQALDCGAGIGRVTKRLLLPMFERVDTVEQDQHFCDNTRSFIGPDAARVGDIYCCGLQDFTPEEKKYSLIWSQWVLGQLEDDDLVAFFKRCQAGLKEGGIIVVKENIREEDKKDFDDTDSSYTRPKDDMEKIMSRAGLNMMSCQKQKGFPKDIYPVYMWALN